MTSLKLTTVGTSTGAVIPKEMLTRLNAEPRWIARNSLPTAAPEQ